MKSFQSIATDAGGRRSSFMMMTSHTHHLSIMRRQLSMSHLLVCGFYIHHRPAAVLLQVRKCNYGLWINQCYTGCSCGLKAASIDNDVKRCKMLEHDDYKMCDRISICVRYWPQSQIWQQCKIIYWFLLMVLFFYVCLHDFTESVDDRRWSTFCNQLCFWILRVVYVWRHQLPTEHETSGHCTHLDIYYWCW